MDNEIDIVLMISDINAAVDGTLTIVHYPTGWFIHSYKEGSVLCDGGIHDPDFTQAVVKAYRRVLEAGAV